MYIYLSLSHWERLNLKVLLSPIYSISSWTGNINEWTFFSRSKWKSNFREVINAMHFYLYTPEKYPNSCSIIHNMKIANVLLAHNLILIYALNVYAKICQHFDNLNSFKRVETEYICLEIKPTYWAKLTAYNELGKRLEKSKRKWILTFCSSWDCLQTEDLESSLIGCCWVVCKKNKNVIHWRKGIQRLKNWKCIVFHIFNHYTYMESTIRTQSYV
jgi:hypothetical protein